MLLRRHHKMRAKGTTTTKEAAPDFHADDPTFDELAPAVPDTRIGAGAQDGGTVDPERGPAQRAAQDPEADPVLVDEARESQAEGAAEARAVERERVADDGSEGLPAPVAAEQAAVTARTRTTRPAQEKQAAPKSGR